jgi:phosphoribosyl-ATP pyrophosphohydrolase
MSRFTDALDHISATIDARRGGDAAVSWTAKLLADPKLAAKKLGEEAIELVQAASLNDTDAVASESADLIYHWLVLLAAKGVDLDAVAAKLEARQAQSGIAEKVARSKT